MPHLLAKKNRRDYLIEVNHGDASGELSLVFQDTGGELVTPGAEVVLTVLNGFVSPPVAVGDFCAMVPLAAGAMAAGATVAAYWDFAFDIKVDGAFWCGGTWRVMSTASATTENAAIAQALTVLSVEQQDALDAFGAEFETGVADRKSMALTPDAGQPGVKINVSVDQTVSPFEVISATDQVLTALALDGALAIESYTTNAGRKSIQIKAPLQVNFYMAADAASWRFTVVSDGSMIWSRDGSGRNEFKIKPNGVIVMVGDSEPSLLNGEWCDWYDKPNNRIVTSARGDDGVMRHHYRALS